MKRNRLFPAICLVAALLLSACSQDELAENSTALPKGEYPLQIGSVSLTAEVSEQPWTRVSENLTDGMSSEFQAGDAIGVNLNGETATYTYDGSAWTSETPLYWKDKQPATVTAWYPVEEEIDFTQQNVKGLTYLLKGTSNTDADFDTPANLTFAHQLAKVRVVLEGTKADEVQQVYVRSYPKSVNNQGALGSSIGTPIYVPMLKTEYNGQRCWEATLRPGHFEADNTFEVAKEGGAPVRVTLAEDKIPVTAGQVTTITINVNPVIPEGTPEIDATGDINGTGAYVVRGNNRTTPINITGGSPTIYLDGATVSVGSGSAINITNNATPTIYVVGENNKIISNSGTGIYVEDGSTVTITGSSRNDELTVTSGDGYPGIGGSMDDSNGVSCGDINISNITVFANGSVSSSSSYVSPGIGCVGSRITCGTITISNATVHASGITSVGYTTPGIGCGFTLTQYPGSIPDVVASNSEIHAHRGNPGYTCDYIGWGAFQDYPSSTYANSTITPGAGSIKSSIVYCYTGETLDKTVVYDENGIDTEQSQ